jgi:hypothetical protein
MRSPPPLSAAPPARTAARGARAAFKSTAELRRYCDPPRRERLDARRRTPLRHDDETSCRPEESWRSRDQSGAPREFCRATPARCNLGDTQLTCAGGVHRLRASSVDSHKPRNPARPQPTRRAASGPSRRTVSAHQRHLAPARLQRPRAGTSCPARPARVGLAGPRDRRCARHAVVITGIATA